ncbi:MAG: trypsin-like peptidase domain-containing protein [Deltaproteobacteria bacterium]|nr:trypsin-like peptidase domain-containing protein [Deltaproteobacteria bacterium]
MSTPALALVTVALLGAPPARPGPAPTAFAQAYNRVEPSVVAVVAQHGRRHRTGAGFVASPDGQVVCSSLTVDGASQVQAWVKGRWVVARVLAVDARLRVALLALEGLTEALQPVPVAPQATLRRNDWVVAVDRRADGLARPVAGLVADSPAQGPGPGRPPVVLVDAPAGVGAPLINLRGEVVGLSLGRLDRTRGRAQSLEPLRAFLVRASGPRAAAVNPG